MTIPKEFDSTMRDPREVTWQSYPKPETDIHNYEVSGDWWDILDELGITLFVTREYEHTVSAFCPSGKRYSSYPIPHPCGIAFDESNERLYIAGSRNPNQLYKFETRDGWMIPKWTQYYPGRTRIHELVFDGDLYVAATGNGSIAKLEIDYLTTHWSIRKWDAKYKPKRHHINSFTWNPFYCSAFSEHPFEWGKAELDGKGVIFNSDREVVQRGYTCPHSLRWHDDHLWMCNSGHGDFGTAEAIITHHDGWTRGCLMMGGYAFVGVSRVLVDKAKTYAPVFDGKESETICAVDIVDLHRETIVGSVKWNNGISVFDISYVPAAWTNGFPPEDSAELFYGSELP